MWVKRWRQQRRAKRATAEVIEEFIHIVLPYVPEQHRDMLMGEIEAWVVKDEQKYASRS